MSRFLRNILNSPPGGNRGASEPEPLTETRLLAENTPLTKSEPVHKLTPVKNDAPPLQIEPVTKNEPVHKTQGVTLLSGSAPHLRFPYEVLDHLLKDLKPAPRVILERLYRLSAGWDSDECTVSINKLCEYCNLLEAQVRKHLVFLEHRGFIKRLENVLGGSDVTIRGIRFKVLLPRIPLTNNRPLAKSEPLTNNRPIKENNTYKETHTNSEERLASRVGVERKSRFSLKECREYAEHLSKTGQGITNPGGYATKIHRRGEADELIAAFLSPVDKPKAIDASLCPDCRGTGFYEPAGPGKGVAKCKHEKLMG